MGLSKRVSCNDSKFYKVFKIIWKKKLIFDRGKGDI